MIQRLPRRMFLMTLAASGAVLATSAQAQALLDEKDAQAVALRGRPGLNQRKSHRPVATT